MTSEKLRLFAGLGIPEAILDAAGDTIEALRADHPQARFVARENHHVTLKFFGWIDAGSFEAAREVCIGAAAEARPFEMNLTEVGAFPSLRRARVVWIGVNDPSGSCDRIARRLDHDSSALGVTPETRPFHPHLTLARFKAPRAITEVAQVQDGAKRSFEVAELLLYRSHLSPRGARYEILEGFALG